MLSQTLAHSVEQFASVVQGMPDVDLERPWAWMAYDSEGVRFAFFRTYEELCELAIKLTSERAASGAPASSAQRILAGYHAAYRDLQGALLGIQPADTEREPADGEWSLRQALAHIVAAEIGFFVVIQYALERHRSRDGRPAEIPEQAWGAVIDRASFEALMDGPFAEILTYYQTFHERVLQAFANISEQELDLPSIYWEGYEMSLRFRLHRFDSHLRQHTIQIDKTLGSIGHRPTEAKRLLRLIYTALAQAEGATVGLSDLGAEPQSEVASKITERTNEIARILGLNRHAV